MSIVRSCLRVGFCAGCMAACQPSQPQVKSSDQARPALADSLIAAGETVYMQGEFEEARSRWNRAMMLARQAADSARIARVMTWLGLAAWRQGDYKQAQQLGQGALQMKLRLGFEADLSKSYNALGLLAWNQGRLQEAADLFNRSLATATATKDGKGIAAASGNLALVQTEMGQYDAARSGLETMLSAGRRLQDARVEGNALTNLGMLDIRIGDPASAVPRLQEARRAYAKIGYGTGEQNALAQLGTAFDALGEPGRAIASLDTALAISRNQGLKQEEAANLETLAAVVRAAGDARRALTLYSEARRINSELELDVELGNDQRAAADILQDLGARQAAEALADSALRIHSRTGAQLEELRDRILLAELAGMSGDIGASRAAIREADQVADRIGAPQAHRELALGEARLADRADDPRRVLRALRRPGAAWASAPFPLQAEAAELAARSYAAIGQLDSAVDQGRRAVYAIERVRGAYRSGPLQTQYLSDRAVVYADLARVLLQQKRIEEAFEVADAARGRALLEHITEQGDSGSGTDGVAQLALAERKLRRFAGLKEQLAVAEAEAQPADTSAQSTLAVLRSVTDSMQRQYQLASAAASELPPSAAVLGAAQPKVMAIQRSLHPGEVLLEYLASDKELLIFGVSPTRINHARVPVRGTVLASRVRLARELLAGSHKDPALAGPVLTALYADLIAPADEWLDGAERLLVATHGVLSYLPFAALRDSLSGRYLAETRTIVHVPSGAGLAALRDRGSRAGGAAVHSAAGFAFAPLPDALRASGDEVQAVGRYASARVVVGRRATETAVRKALAAGGLIHIASHGYMNSGNPMNSRLALRPTGNSGAEDGWLEVHEVLGLTIASPLLFLSGCETGLGGAWSTSFAPGDDFVTLAQAFLHAGAENVVGTLWRVQDRAAAEFAGAFYQALQSSDPAAALAQAQRAMLREQAFAHPYHWAGYRITGSALGPAGRKFRAGVRLSIETGSAHLPPSISSFMPGVP